MGSWLWISNDVSQNYDNIIKVIAQKWEANTELLIKRHRKKV